MSNTKTKLIVFGVQLGLRQIQALIITHFIIIVMSFIGRQIDKSTKVNISFYLPMNDVTMMMKSIMISAFVC